MPTLAQVRAAIVSKLEGVTNIGQVQSYERYTKRQADFADFYVYSGKVHGWLVRRISRQTSSTALGRWTIVNRWIIRGYYALDDSAQSEIVFDTLIDAIIDAFRTDETLGDVVDSTVVGDDAGIQLEDSGPVMLSGILCHSCQLRLNTRHYE